MGLVDSKHILIVGFGITGKSIANYCIKKKIPFSIYDQKQSTEVIKQSPLSAIAKNIYSGLLSEDIFEGVDAVAMSPGVDPRNPIFKKIKQSGTLFFNDLDLFANEIKNKSIKLIGITGSNGKTTVASLIKCLLDQYQVNAKLVGNIGTPILDIVDELNNDFVVMEVSSFQLELGTTLHFDIGVILNITEDHMDRYDSFKDYIDAKLNLFKRSKIKIINYDDPVTNDWFDLNTICLSASEKNLKKVDYHLAKQGKRSFTIKNKKNEINLSHLKFVGDHNFFNIMAAISVIDQLGFSLNNVNSYLSNFKLASHRLEWVRELKGINFYNDSKATNVASSVAAITSFEEKKVLVIMGGDSKKQSLKPLYKCVDKFVKELFLIGKDANLFIEELKTLKHVNINLCQSMREAVNLAFNKSKKNEIILLSPACSSLDAYKNYMERGDEFKALVMDLKE
jgi:UDP-N-acetylmuramoylalanine--D-glutamate ligase